MTRATLHARRTVPIATAASLALLLSACSVAGLPALKPGKPERVAAAVTAAESEANGPAGSVAGLVPLAFAAPAPSRASNVDALIVKYAAHYDVPEALVRRVVQKESGYNPRARNGPNLGLMQIQHGTARSMGYTGSPEGLLDADTNLRYAVKYLRGAWLVGGRNPDAAIRHYQRGYYYDAKRKGMLDEVGL